MTIGICSSVCVCICVARLNRRLPLGVILHVDNLLEELISNRFGGKYR